jgi:hypothetical protein
MRTRTTQAALIAAIAVLVSVLVFTGVGAAALTTYSIGGYSDRQYFATNDQPYLVPSTTWVNVPGMVATVTVPAGTRRLLNARFTAESQCIGSGYCSARVIYTRGTSTVELYPQSGTDYAFDSGSTDSWEGHALERDTRYFPSAGTYTVRVQAAQVGTVSTYRLDDTHLTVEAVRP